jgi:preprotein translocase subunit YajC
VNLDELVLEIAENVRVRVMRSMIANVLAKTEPAESEDKGEGAETSKP